MSPEHNEEKEYSPFFIKSVSAKNIRLFKDVHVTFNDGFNFLAGPNGSGKTSLLRLIALSVSLQLLNDSRFGDEASVWTDLYYDGNTYRVGETSRQGQPWVVTDSYMQTRHLNNLQPEVPDGGTSVGTWEIDDKIPFFAPLFIGAYRKIEYRKIEGMKREEGYAKRRQSYRQNGAASLNGGFLPDVKQWLINRYFQIEKDWAANEKINWKWLIDNLSHIGPTESGFKFKEIKRDMEPVFLLYDKECFLEELSAGYQSVLSLVLAIVEWIETTNEAERMIVEKSTGTVLVDELDVHLHPEWQLTIRNSLRKIFPKLQFIITTHSPHLLASAEKGELIIIPEHHGVLDLKPTHKCFSGWNTDQILEDVMGVTSLENKTYAKLITEAFEAIESKNVPQIEKSIDQLKSVTHPSDTIVSVLQVKLAEIKLESSND